MKPHAGSGWLVFLVFLTAANISRAANYNVDCGASGSSSAVQAVVDSIAGSPGNTINVTGTCNGDLSITRADRLTISALTINGNLSLNSTTLVSLLNLQGTGTFSLVIYNSRRTSVTGATLVGEVDISGGSSVSFRNVRASPSSDSSGTHDPQINCIGQSECSFTGLTLIGSGTAAGDS